MIVGQFDEYYQGVVPETRIQKSSAILKDEDTMGRVGRSLVTFFEWNKHLKWPIKLHSPFSALES